MKILLIEDERTLAKALQRGLGSQGLLTDVAHDGQSGLDAALTGNYDVILLDIMVPRVNGYDVCKRVRAAEVWTPIMMLSAKDGEFDVVDAFDLGADDYMTKPFSFPILVARLKALIRRGGTERPVVLTAGDIRLDTGKKTVHRGEDLIDLTPREFALLHYLMRNRGLVVSKLDILQAVWDIQHDGVGENVVEVYISYLRRKLDTPFNSTTIMTVRGSGYMLNADGGRA